MSRIVLGLICGLTYGILDVALMVPLKMEDKKRAMVGAFVHRFGIGFLICNASLPWYGWLNGFLIGVLLSIPPAVITKSYVPILVVGAIGGAIIGYIAG